MANNELMTCIACGNEVAKTAKTCPNCGSKPRKPFSKTINGKIIKWIFILYILITLDFIINERSLPDETSTSSSNTESTIDSATDTTEDTNDLSNETNTTVTDDGTLQGNSSSSTDLNKDETTSDTQSETNNDISSDEPVVNQDGSVEPIQIEQ